MTMTMSLSMTVKICWQTGWGVGSKVHLLSKVEDCDVISVMFMVWVYN